MKKQYTSSVLSLRRRGLSYSQIADQLDMPIGEIKAICGRDRRKKYRKKRRQLLNKRRQTL